MSTETDHKYRLFTDATGPHTYAIIQENSELATKKIKIHVKEPLNPEAPFTIFFTRFSYSSGNCI